jgi:hypothetical protein
MEKKIKDKNKKYIDDDNFDLINFLTVTLIGKRNLPDNSFNEDLGESKFKDKQHDGDTANKNAKYSIPR